MSPKQIHLINKSRLFLQIIQAIKNYPLHFFFCCKDTKKILDFKVMLHLHLVEFYIKVFRLECHKKDLVSERSSIPCSDKAVTLVKYDSLAQTFWIKSQ